MKKALFWIPIAIMLLLLAGSVRHQTGRALNIGDVLGYLKLVGLMIGLMGAVIAGYLIVFYGLRFLLLTACRWLGKLIGVYRTALTKPLASVTALELLLIISGIFLVLYILRGQFI